MKFKEYVKIREEKFGSIVFDTLKEKVFISNETGKKILKLLEDDQPVDKIIKDLANTYNVPPLDIKDDILNFITELKNNNIINL